MNNTMMNRKNYNWFLIILSVFILLVISACGNTRDRIDEEALSEDLTPRYTGRISVEFIPNLLFSKYDVDFSVDGVKIGSLSHGVDGEYSIELKEGIHTISFKKKGLSYPSGETMLAVTCDVVASYRISCYKDRVEIETQYVDYIADPSSEIVKINCSAIDFHGKEYESALANLAGLGFTKIQEDPIYDVKKGDKKVGLVEEVIINGEKKYSFGDSFKSDVEVVVRYHLPHQEENGPSSTQEPTTMPSQTNQPSQPESTPMQVITIDNNDAFKALLTAEAVDPDVQEEFVKKYKGNIVEFDAIVFFMEQNPKYNTIYSYVIVPGPGADKMVMGATFFMLENMSMFDFKWDKSTRPEYLSIGSKIRIQAKVSSGSDPTFIYLTPTCTWGR